MKKAGFTLLISLIVIFIALYSSSARADKGSVSPGPVRISEDSQRAIILHNTEEEILILGTELTAEEETGVLEFIPFPAEPDVAPAGSEVFDEAVKLLNAQNIALLDMSDIAKGGAAEKAPVEIRMSKQIGLHDLTVIKTNDIEQFTTWVEQYFEEKGISVTGDLGDFYGNAQDYIQRGINYFVLDYVVLQPEKRSVEPLVYRFRSPEIYYPLKTSNVVGGSGRVDLIFICPGSFSGHKFESVIHPDLLLANPYLELSETPPVYLELSNSAEITREQITPVYPGAEDFFSEDTALYVQVMSYTGNYDFPDDFFFDPPNLDPRAYVWHSISGAYPWETEYFLKPAQEK